MWNLKHKNKVIDTENKLVVARGGEWGRREKLKWSTCKKEKKKKFF